MKTKIIAEIGINHNGDLELAKQLIEESANAGAHFVKFQKRNPDICVPEHQKDILRDTPWGKLKYIDYKKKIEFGKKEYDYLYQIAKDNKVELFFSVWDEDSLNFALQYESEYIKIPSSLNQNLDLIKKAKSTRRTIIISTGMIEWQELYKIIEIFQDDLDRLILLHCVSEYPCKNPYLDTINKLKNIHHRIGYSSHDTNYIIPAVTALFDVQMIEIHVSLDKKLWGTDQSISFEFNDVKKLLQHINEFENSKGIKTQILTEEYISFRKLKNHKNVSKN